MVFFCLNYNDPDPKLRLVVNNFYTTNHMAAFEKPENVYMEHCSYES